MVFSDYFCLMLEGSGAGSVLVTNGSGCGYERPKNLRILWIRIRITACFPETEFRPPAYCHAFGGLSQRGWIHEADLLYQV
jgi:hypothetical protein